MAPEGTLAKPSAEGAHARPDRAPLLAFVTDAPTEAALREGLADTVPQGLDIRRGAARAAIGVLQKTPTPRTLVVDVSGEEHPLTVLDELSRVVEPDARVLVIGDREDVNFYRQVTRGLGALEYLYKPLLPDMVARFFAPSISGQAPALDAGRGGRVVVVTGVRGGVGASTLAANLAWHFGIEANRHTVLLDADLYRGCCAMLLGARTGAGLRNALETPSRIDELFVERATQPVGDRLHVLATEEKLSDQPAYAPGAAAKLLDALRGRYNFIVADVPFTGQPLHRELLDLAHQRVLVLEPTLASVRDALRFLSLPNGRYQPHRAVVVLNRAGAQGCLTRKQVETALGMPPDIVVPDLPKAVESAASLGEPAAKPRGAFRAGIQELAQQVAFVRVLDGAEGASARAPGWRRLLPGRRR